MYVGFGCWFRYIYSSDWLGFWAVVLGLVCCWFDRLCWYWRVYSYCICCWYWLWLGSSCFGCWLRLIVLGLLWFGNWCYWNIFGVVCGWFFCWGCWVWLGLVWWFLNVGVNMLVIVWCVCWCVDWFVGWYFCVVCVLCFLNCLWDCLGVVWFYLRYVVFILLCGYWVSLLVWIWCWFFSCYWWKDVGYCCWICRLLCLCWFGRCGFSWYIGWFCGLVYRLCLVWVGGCSCNFGCYSLFCVRDYWNVFLYGWFGSWGWCVVILLVWLWFVYRYLLYWRWNDGCVFVICVFGWLCCSVGFGFFGVLCWSCFLVLGCLCFWVFFSVGDRWYWLIVCSGFCWWCVFVVRLWRNNVVSVGYVCDLDRVWY